MSPSSVPSGHPAPWPVVLIHGTRTSHSQWDLQLPFLRAAGHPVSTPDLPGHGGRRDQPFTLEAATETILTDLRRAHEETSLPVHLVGSSLGGLLAIHAAARLGADEDVLGSLTPCGAALQPGPRLARGYGRLMGVSDLLPAARSGEIGPPFTWLLGRDGARAYLGGGRAEISVVEPAFAAVASLDLRAELAAIPVPVTFLHGHRDQLRLHERSFAAAAPQGRVELLTYGDHMVNLKRPGRFAVDLLRVLARTERERGEDLRRP